MFPLPLLIESRILKTEPACTFDMPRCARGKQDYGINCTLGLIIGDNPKNILVPSKRSTRRHAWKSTFYRLHFDTMTYILPYKV